MVLRANALALLLGAAALSSTQPGEARPWRVNQVPNGPVAGCLTCHVYPGGPRNSFGEHVESYAGVGFLVTINGRIDVAWGLKVGNPPKSLAELDSDGDGRTNGAELLDPLDSWRVGNPHPGEPALVRVPSNADSPVVIRQLYAAGGSTGALFQQDFVELFNRSSAPVSLAGWSLQYASPSGSDAWGSSASALTQLPSVVLQPGQSYLVQGASGGGGGAPLAAPDLVDPSPMALGDGGGKVALASVTTPLGCNKFPTLCSEATMGLILDYVGYGTAVAYEGTDPAPIPSATTALVRRAGGCLDIGSNGSSHASVPADFTAAAVSPRNTGTALTPCEPVAPSLATAVPARGALPLKLLLALLAAVGLRGIRRHERNLKVRRGATPTLPLDSAGYARS